MFIKKVLSRHSHVSGLCLVYIDFHVIIAMWFIVVYKLFMCTEVDPNCVSVCIPVMLWWAILVFFLYHCDKIP